jgi:hypothetical protein
MLLKVLAPIANTTVDVPDNPDIQLFQSAINRLWPGYQPHVFPPRTGDLRQSLRRHIMADVANILDEYELYLLEDGQHSQDQNDLRVARGEARKFRPGYLL